MKWEGKRNEEVKKTVEMDKSLKRSETLESTGKMRKRRCKVEEEESQSEEINGRRWGRSKPQHIRDGWIKCPWEWMKKAETFCQLINCSKLAELSFSICSLKLGKERWGGGMQEEEDLLILFPPFIVSLVHMMLFHQL